MCRSPSLLIFLALTALGCHPQHIAHHETGTYTVTTPLRKNTELVKEYVAQIRAIQHIELRALERGYLMGRFQVRQGSLLDEGELLTTLSDDSTVWVYFNVTEAEYLSYQQTSREGAAPEVQLEMANGQLFEERGKAETIEADFNNETGNIAFRATVKNPKGLLRHGEMGKVLVEGLRRVRDGSQIQMEERRLLGAWSLAPYLV